MAKSKPLPELISLGKKIVGEFSQQGNDNASLRWMGHYLAEVIQKAENEKSATKKAAYQKECVEIIEQLWKKRAYFPDRTAPASKFKHVISILAELKDEERDGFSFQHYFEPADNPIAEYVRNIRRSTESIFKICLKDSVSDEDMASEMEWLTHAPALATNERQIIEEIYVTLNIGKGGKGNKKTKAKNKKTTTTKESLQNQMIEDLIKQHALNEKYLVALKKALNYKPTGSGDEN